MIAPSRVSDPHLRKHGSHMGLVIQREQRRRPFRRLFLCIIMEMTTPSFSTPSFLPMLSLQFQRVAVPAALFNISFLAFSSQLLFSRISPEPLRPRQAVVFNALIACSLICYARACWSDAGYISSKRDPDHEGPSGRWCMKCDGPKQPRSHHCRVCKRFALPSSYKRVDVNLTIAKDV